MEKKFLDLIKETLEIEDRELTFSDKFRTYDEWDSLAYLSIIALLDDEYNVQIEEAEFKQLQTLQDLYERTQK